MLADIKAIIRKSFLSPLNKDLDLRLHNWRLYFSWVINGKPVPPPHIVKQMAIKKYAKRYSILNFVETGTYKGDMVMAMSKTFKNIYSIELGEDYYQRAKERFTNQSHITILQGDSGEVLQELLLKIREPCLFWLDGHYSGGKTAKGAMDTPIRKELNHIFKHNLALKHIILIDDAREFTGEGGYPTLNELNVFVKSAGYNNFEIENDIIRILL
jgi:hypothetical protein